MGRGSDQLITSAAEGDEWAIEAGAGNDVILVEDTEYVYVGQLSVAAGAGRDTLAIAGFGEFDDFQVGFLDVDMGNQNDVMYVSANHALGGSLQGGAGVDIYRQDPTVVAFLPPESFENEVYDQPLGSTWLGLRDAFLTAWTKAGGDPSDLNPD